jgi:hypothetical protein
MLDASADFLEPNKAYSSYHSDNKKITINNLKVGRCVVIPESYLENFKRQLCGYRRLLAIFYFSKNF